MAPPRILSTHRYAWSRNTFVVLFAPFLAWTSLNLHTAFVSKDPKVLHYRGDQAVAVLVFAVVVGALVWCFWKITLTGVTLREDGIDYRLPVARGFMPWGEVTRYEFAFWEAQIDLLHHFPETRFSEDGDWGKFLALITDRFDRNISIGPGLSRMAHLCETIVDQVDRRLVPEVLRIVRAGGRVPFGEASLTSDALEIPGVGIVPLRALRAIHVLDGEVRLIDEKGDAANIGSLPNAYALQSAVKQLCAGSRS